MDQDLSDVQLGIIFLLEISQSLKYTESCFGESYLIFCINNENYSGCGKMCEIIFRCYIFDLLDNDVFM